MDNATVLEEGCSRKRKRDISSSTFDCSICLDKPIDPVLTICGHLYCFKCFLGVPYSTTKRCPVCREDVFHMIPKKVSFDLESRQKKFFAIKEKMRELRSSLETRDDLVSREDNYDIAFELLTSTAEGLAEHCNMMIPKEVSTVDFKSRQPRRNLSDIIERVRELKISFGETINLTSEIRNLLEQVRSEHICDRLVQLLKWTVSDLTILRNNLWEVWGLICNFINQGVKRMCDLFDCTICQDKPVDPILTNCGHLFCWQCFYQLPYDLDDSRRCTLCLGYVAENDIIPIYCSNEDENERRVRKKCSTNTIPPRPKASDKVKNNLPLILIMMQTSWNFVNLASAMMYLQSQSSDPSKNMSFSLARILQSLEQNQTQTLDLSPCITTVSLAENLEYLDKVPNMLFDIEKVLLQLDG